MTTSDVSEPIRRRRRLLAALTSTLLALGWVVIGAPTAVADGPSTFSNTASIAIPATGSADQMGPASPYPSPITVAGMTGLVTSVKVAFHGLSHGALSDIDAMVVAPSGQNLVVLSDVGDPNQLVTTSNADFTFSDAADGPVPAQVNVPSGTYKPTNIDIVGGDTFPGSAPKPSTQTTLAGAFTGISANGTWDLYVVDDTSGDTGTMAGGWSLIVTTEVAATATTTTVTSSDATSTTGDPVTFTATVRAGGSAVTSGSVQFSENGTNLGSAVTLNGTGVSRFTTSALSEGTHAIRATYSGATGFLSSNGTVSQRVDNATVVTGNTFCNTGILTVPALGAAQPYPSNIMVSGQAGQVTKVTATIKGLTHTAPIDLDVLLSGPAPAKNLFLLSDVGGNLNSVSNADLTFDDAAANTVPSPIVSGTFRPTNDDDGSRDAMPPPAPTPTSATALSTFDGASGNGTWSLWVNDDASGDSGSIAGGWCLTITSQVPTTTTLTTTPNPSTFGQPVTLTATVTGDGDPVDQGSVQFTDGGSAIGGPVAVGNDGKATVTTSTLSVGSHAIEASFSGAGDLADSSGTATQVVDKAATATVLTSASNPSDVGAAVTFTATVTSGGDRVTTGSVQFSDGGTDLGAAVPVAADGTASYPTSALAAGTHAIRASYGGTAELATSSDDLDQVVDKLLTTTSLVSDRNPSRFGDPVTLTATVTSGGDPATPGSVQFSDDGTDLGALVTLAADGTATYTTAALSVGTHPITATYSGTDDLAQSSAELDQAVDALATTTGLTSDANPSIVGDTVTFTATVASGGGPVTGGSVQFSDGATPLGGAVALAADGTATFSTAGLTVGTHTIIATFSGTTEYTASTSPGLDQVVDPLASVTTVTSSPNPSTFGESVTFTATVSSGGTPLTSGTVDFSDGGTPLCAGAAVQPGGAATCSTDVLLVGSHTITATYAGTTDVATSSGSVVQVVDKVETTTELSDTPAGSSPLGEDVTFTAAVTSEGGPVGAGTVAFSIDGTVVEAAAAVNSSGLATYTTSTLAAGDHTVVAEYSGSDSYDGSVSPAIPHEVRLIADAGGPYTVAEGGSLDLDASASSPDLTYEWDVNGDNAFGDASGPSPTLSWSDLEALGIDDGPASYNVTVEVVDGATTISATATTLTVTNTAPTAVITGDLTATVGVPFTVKVGADDPSSADLAAQFTYTVDWGDGSAVETVTGPADPRVTHVYTAEGTVNASFTATDKDGGKGGPTIVQVQVGPAETQSPTAPPSTVPPTAPPSSSATSVSAGNLASTGADVGLGTIVLGAVLLLGGGALLLVARRRRAGRGLHR